MAAEHKLATCAIRLKHHLLLRSRPCDSPDCTPKVRGNQCAGLRRVENGAISMIYTESNGQFHWGASPAGRWALYDVKNDPACQKDLARSNPERVSAMVEAYERWWNGVYPVMIARSGDDTEEKGKRQVR